MVNTPKYDRHRVVRAFIVAMFAAGCGSANVHVEFTADTAADPVPYAPEVTPSGDTNGTYGLLTTDGRRSPRFVAIAFFQALIDGDEGVLRQLAADDFGPLGGGGRFGLPPGSFWIQARQLQEPPGADVGRYVNESDVRDRPMSRRFARGIPGGLEASDRVVSVPLTADGSRVWGEVTGQGRAQEANIVVRSSQGRVLAYF